MVPPATSLQQAVFERFDNGTSWTKLSRSFDVEEWKIRHAHAQWMRNPPESQPIDPADVHIPLSTPGRPCALTTEEEMIIKSAVLYFADKNTPLHKEGLLDLVQHYVHLMPVHRQQQIAFKENRPSLQWLQSFLKRNNLSYKSMRMIHDKRIEAITEKKNLAEHSARIRAALKRYSIRDGSRIFNMDQSGVSFAKMVGRSLRKGIGSEEEILVHTAIRTKGNLERVTVMPVVSAGGRNFTPVVVYPGIQAHFRKVNGVIQTVHDFLPRCYFYQREIPGVDSDIIFDWAQKFVKEVGHIRQKSEYVLLLIDGYGSHVQFATLQLFREHRIIVIAMPSHSSQRLQPLDVSAFSSYKSYMQREVQKFARHKKVLNAFDVAICIRNAYTASHNSSNVISGFRRTGVWDADICDATIDPRLYLLESNDKENSDPAITAKNLLRSFEKHERSLLRDADVEESGTIKVKTRKGCHLTSETVIDALQKRDSNRKAKSKRADLQQDLRDYKEPAKDIRHLGELAPERAKRRRELIESRDERRFQRRLSAQRRNMNIYGNSQGAIISCEESEG